MVQVSGSPPSHPAALNCQLNYATMCGPLPTFFGDVNSVPRASGAEFTQEIPAQSQERAEGCYPDRTEKETKKQKTSGSSGVCSPKTSGVAPGDLYSLTQLQDVNLNLGHATRRSARCAAASTAGRQSYRMSSFQESAGSQDVAKEKKVPPENPEEQGALPPVRKKTRTFYSAEQLEELERMFQEDHYPDNEKRREIAAAVGVTPQRIMVWFQNRRAKWRKMEKLSVKGSKKCPAPTTLSLPSGASTYGASLLPMPPLPDFVHDQSAMLNMDTTAGNYPSMLSGHSAPLNSSSVSSVTGAATCCEAGQTKAPSQGSFSSSRMECFPTIPSPPPIRRASLPLNMSFNPNNHIVPLMLDTPNSECSPSSQESSSREVLAYSFQTQGVGSPTPCNYPDQLEPTANLETPYYHYSSQPGTYQLPQYAQQHQLSQFHHLPIPLASNVLPSVRLTPTTPSESNPAFFTLAGNSGVVSYGAAGASRGYLQHHIGGQILLQQPAGSSGGIAAYQAVPWSELYMQGAPFSNQFCSRMQFSSTAAGRYPTEQVPYTQNPTMQPTPCFLQLPKGATSASVVFTEKQKAMPAPDQTSYQNHPPQIAPTEREDQESSSSIAKEEKNAADGKEENTN
ncbi:homeobox protein NOBOX [Emydura macquarii macquarii]|uniref:homeobox protein NOBOX n=1 Tax=Emydura macquarii macquarii TaxID=1129001 RepID=UPI00352B10E8